MTKIFADCANLNEIYDICKDPQVKGITTNPTLMKKDGVTDYVEFATELLKFLSEERPDTCLSLEVFADSADEMYNQAIKIAAMAPKFHKFLDPYRVYVKIPITNTKGESMVPLIKRLNSEKVKVNVTALMTLKDITNVLDAIDFKVPTILSIFAGRIADTSADPVPLIKNSIEYYHDQRKLRFYQEQDYENLNSVEFLWASTREILNIKQATDIDCDIITVPVSMIKKYVENYAKPLDGYSLETVQQFRNDAIVSGFTL